MDDAIHPGSSPLLADSPHSFARSINPVILQLHVEHAPSHCMCGIVCVRRWRCSSGVSSTTFWLTVATFVSPVLEHETLHPSILRLY